MVSRMPAVDGSRTGWFLVDGRLMKGWQTPTHYNMEDGDEVDVFTEQLGGGGPLRS